MNQDLYNPSAAPEKPSSSSRDWYSVSIESMRRTLVLLVAVVALLGAAFSYQHWEAAQLSERAAEVVKEARSLRDVVEERPDGAQLRREYHAAWDHLEAARRALKAETFDEAFERGTLSVLQFKDALDDGEPDATRGHFVTVVGDVEYRRGDRGQWKRARPQDAINFGDWVKTAAVGSAQILFPDGSEYRLRANTMVHLTQGTDRFGRSEQVAEMAFGWVELTTDDTPSAVRTPKTRAAVRQDSEAVVAFDRDSATATVAAYQGSVEVTSDSGQTQVVGTLEEVVQRGDLLSAPRSLPGRPQLTGPSDTHLASLSSGELRLGWRPVGGATGYDLRIAPSELFASLLIDDRGRSKTSARVGLQAEGVYWWQVAARDGDGLRGPWSRPRSFRVAQLDDRRGDDQTPPMLRVDSVQTYGRLVIVSGATEADATVEVGGEAAAVGVDGGFSASLTLEVEGFTFIEVVAEDPAGNRVAVERRVFVESAS